MSIQPNTIGRGCASAFRQPVSPADERESRNLYYAVHYINCVRPRGPRLPRIVYRSSTWDHDVLHRVFCFDLSLTVEYEDVFRDGLGAPPKGSTPDEVYYDLLDHVNSAGREVGTPRAFISTTLSPSLATCRLTNPIGTIIQRYEIYAPGGISIGATLGDRCNYPGQGEVTFVRGVAPQYIHAVQPFVITGYTDQGFAILDRWSPIKAVNRNFDPQSHPSRALDVVNPACDYIDLDGQRQALLYGIYSISHWKGVEVEVEVEAKAVTATAMSLSNDAWYSYGVQENESYINAAFRSSRTNEAYLFMSNDYVLVNYDPGSTEEDRIVNGPLLICQGYASLAGTAFAEHGIDCSFGTHYGDEAYVFSGNLVALIDYAPAKAALDWIISGPMTIASMFPFLEGTVFEHGIDAAFEATAGSEAYLFRGDTCALINYRSNPRAIRIQPIEQGFSSLGGTIFEDGLEAAFASHRRDEAYLFKGKHYAVINFASRSRKDYVVGGVEEILPNWPSLRGILPRKNRGLDAHDHD